MPLDPTSFTTSNALIGLGCATSNRTLLRGQPGQTKEFTAVVSTDAVHMNRNIMNMLFGNFEAIEDPFERSQHRLRSSIVASDSARSTSYRTSAMIEYGQKSGAWMCTAIIIASNSGNRFDAINNCHNFLPTCDESAHLTTKVLIPAASVADIGMIPTEGDVIRITAKYNRYGKLNIDRATYVGISKKRQFSENAAASASDDSWTRRNYERASCDDALLVELFDRTDSYSSSTTVRDYTNLVAVAEEDEEEESE
tara:strand:- start:8546 stop:9307 length:762 start_codon:yes stop_codon:yes gene_type:complete